MSSFDPMSAYTIVPKPTRIQDFHSYTEEYVVRPPYQRKMVWGRAKQQALLDSLFRRYYIPRIVLREVRMDKQSVKNEVIDGQQRITTVQLFFDDKLPLPQTLSDLGSELSGKLYSELPTDVRRFVDRLQYDVDLVKDIDDPHNAEHQRIATEIFWRLQQGESLNYMEVAHSRLSSLARNFVVKYADDQTFDYERYEPLETNPDKHDFFRVIDRGNNRMQHLALLTRFLMLEEDGGPTDLNNGDVETYIKKYQRDDGVGNLSLEKYPFAKQVLSNMTAFYKVFENDPMVTQSDGMKEFKVEYFIISLFLLLRHLRKHYVWQDGEQGLFYEFVQHFHERWRSPKRSEHLDIIAFADARQQGGKEVETRDRIIRQLFFQFALSQGHQMLAKDDRRAFNEQERIKIYRRDDGLCQQCLKEGRPEKEALVPWDEYQADHVLPHSRGGRTDVSNAVVLCSYHNQSKGADMPS